jgi:hypothetical protein
LYRRLCRSQDVLAFPSVQRHRYFRLKQRLPAAAARAATLAPAALAAAAATAALRAHALGSPMAAALPLSAGGAVAALLAGFLCTFCWLAASATVEVVFSERMRPDDYSQRDELGAMAASLSGKKGGFMQALALHDARYRLCTAVMPAQQLLPRVGWGAAAAQVPVCYVPGCLNPLPPSFPAQAPTLSRPPLHACTPQPAARRCRQGSAAARRPLRRRQRRAVEACGGCGRARVLLLRLLSCWLH